MKREGVHADEVDRRGMAQRRLRAAARRLCSADVCGVAASFDHAAAAASVRLVAASAARSSRLSDERLRGDAVNIR